MLWELSRPEVAGSIRTGFRSLVCERLVSADCVVCGPTADRWQLAEELVRLSAVTRIFDATDILENLERKDVPEELPRSFPRERWFRSFEWDNAHILFLFTDPEIEPPQDLIDDTCERLVNLAAGHIRQAMTTREEPSPAGPEMRLAIFLMRPC